MIGICKTCKKRNIIEGINDQDYKGCKWGNQPIEITECKNYVPLD